jgi:hypothetical protein
MEGLIFGALVVSVLAFALLLRARQRAWEMALRETASRPGLKHRSAAARGDSPAAAGNAEFDAAVVVEGDATSICSLDPVLRRALIPDLRTRTTVSPRRVELRVFGLLRDATALERHAREVARLAQALCVP